MAYQGRFGADGAVEFSLRVDTSKMDADLTKLVTKIEILERTITDTTRLIARMTGDENLQRAGTVIIHTISLINQLQLASNLLMASNPWLFPLGVLGFANMAVSAVDMAGSYI